MFRRLINRTPAARVLMAIGLGGAVLAGGCGKRGFGESKPMGLQARVTVEDAWILNHTPKLLQVMLAFEGGDPNLKYDLQAALRTAEDGYDFGGGWIHQVAIPQHGATNQHRVVWEFLAFPKDSPNIYFCLNYRDKETGQAESVGFKLPGARHLRLRKMGSQ